MKKYTSIIIILTWLYSTHTLQAQKQTTFYLMPHAGIEWPISKFEDKNNIPSIIDGISPTTSAKYGISLLVDFNNKWNLNIGYGIGGLGEGFKWNIIDSTFISFHGTKNTTSTVRRGFLSISKPLKLIEIRKKNHAYLNPLLKINKEYAYWAVFDINLLAGVSYEYSPPEVFMDQPFSGPLSHVNSAIEINRYGTSIYTGVFFQFYKNNKKRLRLGVVYHKGLKKRLSISKKVFFQGVEHPPNFEIYSRGSMVAIYIAYPIKLFTIKEKGTVKGL